MDVSFYNAPRWTNFDANQASNVDEYFDGPVELGSNISTDGGSAERPSDASIQIAQSVEVCSVSTSTCAEKTLSNLVMENEAKGVHRSALFDTPTNPTIDNLKNSYRAPLVVTPLSVKSTGKSAKAASQESPELEYARPWLSETSQSLVTAMRMLNIRSPKGQSITPCNRDRNVCFTAEILTPFITENDRSIGRSAETGADELQNSNDAEIRNVENTAITTQIRIHARTENEAAEFCENREKECRDDSLKVAEAAGQPSDQIVPIVPTNEYKTYIIAERSELRGSKEVGESSTSNEPAYKNSEFDVNLHEPSTSKEFPCNNTKFEEYFDDRQISIGMDKKCERKKATKPRVLTSQVRRQSLKYRRRSGQFISMAEAILKFQRGTPKRFRSNSKNKIQSGHLQDAAHSRKVTCPMSPVLRCKSRSRPTIVSNQQERETLEIEEARRNVAKPNPSKPMTITKKPINLSEKLSVPEQHKDSTLQSSPSSSNFLLENNKVSNHLHAPELSKHARKRTPVKKTVTKVFSTDVGPALKEIEIFNFGVPAIGTCRKVTRVMPFSFDTRDKKIQTGSENAKRETKSMYHAKTSLATARMSMATTTKTVAEATATTTKTAPGATREQRINANTKSTSTLSFEERNNLLLKKRKEFRKLILQQEKQARIFHARPAPTFKPVTVHATSAENLKIEYNQRIRGTSPITRTQSPGDLANQENRSPNHIAARLKKRQEFDAKIKKKEEEEKARRMEEEAEQFARIKKEERELRKTMESKAKPMPTFKAPKIVKSLKPLTDPQSPKWSRKK